MAVPLYGWQQAHDLLLSVSEYAGSAQLFEDACVRRSNALVLYSLVSGFCNPQFQATPRIPFVKELAKATALGLTHMCSSSPVLGTTLSGQMSLLSGSLTCCATAWARLHPDETARLQVAAAVTAAGELAPGRMCTTHRKPCFVGMCVAYILALPMQHYPSRRASWHHWNKQSDTGRQQQR